MGMIQWQSSALKLDFNKILSLLNFNWKLKSLGADFAKDNLRVYKNE